MCNSKKIISYICIIFCTLILMLVLNKIQLYSDDFYYKTFLNSSFNNFVNLNIEHYQTVNGRVLVHLLDEVMLNMNIYVYITFIVLCLNYCFYSMCKFLLNRTNCYSKENVIYGVCLSWCLFLLIDVYVLKETVFWMTGAFNYVFPITMTFLALSSIKKVFDNSKVNLIQIITIFLAATTTEQGFISLFLYTIGYSIIYNIDKKITFNKYGIIFLFTEILGFLTIFLSPASRMRANTSSTIFNSSIVQLFKNNFEVFSQRIVGENGIYVLMSFLLISIALLSIKDRRLSKILYSGLLIGTTIVLENIFAEISGVMAIVITIIIILYIIMSIIELFKCNEYRNIALMLIVAFLLQGATFALNEVSYRSFYILSLICVITIASILTIVSTLFKNGIISISCMLLMMTFSIIHMLPIIEGYSYNKLIFDNMKRSIEEYEKKGVVEINLDVKNKYSHTMGYMNGDFYEYFLQNYGLKEIENDIYFVKNEESKIFVNEELIRYPALFENNEIFVPTRYIVEAINGKCEWTKEETIYSFENYFVKVSNYSNRIIECSIEEYIGIDMNKGIKNYLGRSYMNVDFLKYIIGLEKENIKIGSKNLIFNTNN